MKRRPKPRGPCDRKNSIPIENFNPGLQFAISIENVNLDRNFQSCSVSIYRALLVLQRRARSKISIHDRSLEIFNPEGRDRIFSIPGPSGRPPLRFLLLFPPPWSRTKTKNYQKRPSSLNLGPQAPTILNLDTQIAKSRSLRHDNKFSRQ